ncbi:MAG: NAD(P)/FAD-dependent oxidoreductase [Dehalogenimonas sp.]|uniref:NAD(P)/FAD-dependent oxidoreductase n=1 Tax=Candidatus Dehalogenimonas loeffleri TaxID=3127115 RepID=A0ABZ2JA08_9CHLR|nr:NAD(P)/FAD-dependent oxidoreductase [Dehalogenimonas sp.]
MQNDLTVIVGGGAAGICAAITSARRGRPVVICEKTPWLGKKILATGNGRCNLLNDDLSEHHYNPAAKDLVRSVFDRYGKKEILDFFKDLGLEVYSQDGRVFPRTNQAASVLKVLDLELKRLGVPVEYDFECTSISRTAAGLTVTAKTGRQINGAKVIIAGGGKTYPAFGADGGAFALAGKLGHTIVEPVPSAVPLVIKDGLCQQLQGQRIFASARSIIGGQPGEPISGELLFTKYGLSGTCILDISREISVALNRERRADIELSVDLVPFLDRVALRTEITRRCQMGLQPEDMLTGFLPNKFGPLLRELFTQQNNPEAAVGFLKDRRFKVTGTRGWNEAEFTSGGVAVTEVNSHTQESLIYPGVYFAGEVLDVDGRRGGYNLAWAWASGMAAGA